MTPDTKAMKAIAAEIMNHEGEGSREMQNIIIQAVLKGNLESAQKSLVELGIAETSRDATVAITIDVHKQQMAGTAMHGNPTRIARHSLTFLMEAIKNDEDYPSLVELLGIEDGDLCSHQEQLILGFAEQMNLVVDVLLGRGMTPETSTEQAS